MSNPSIKLLVATASGCSLLGLYVWGMFYMQKHAPARAYSKLCPEERRAIEIRKKRNEENEKLMWELMQKNVRSDRPVWDVWMQDKYDAEEKKQKEQEALQKEKKS